MPFIALAAGLAGLGWFIYNRLSRGEAASDTSANSAPVISSKPWTLPTVAAFTAPDETYKPLWSEPKMSLPTGSPGTFARPTKGLRNRNPGNIRWIESVPKRWRGMVKNDGSNYAIFESDALGVRAIGKQLQVYATTYNLYTVRGIITRWAPPVENLTLPYVNAVSKALNVGPDVKIDVTARLHELAAAIIKHENGVQPYNVNDIKTWVNMP